MSNFAKSLPDDDTIARTKELLRKKEELEAELRRIEHELQKMTTFSCSDGNMHSSDPEVSLERRFAVNYSIKNRWDVFSCNFHQKTNFETSSAFDLRGTFISRKKETFSIYGKRPNLAQLVDGRKIDQKRYYIGCMTGLIQEHVQTVFKEETESWSRKLYQCNVVVYHENMVNFPKCMQRKFMLAAMSGFDFEAVSELVDLNGLDSGKMSSEFTKTIEEYKAVSKFIRKCYGAGMQMPFDGRIIAIVINDEEIAQDVEEAVVLLGGCPVVIDEKHKVPFGISHVIHERKKIKDKSIGFTYRIDYHTFFKDLEIEFDRLRVRALE